MATNMETILASIESARRDGVLSNDAARAATIALGLTGDDAMLACRVLAQGSDPASIEYLATGKVSALVATAHRFGPGGLTGDDKAHWLYLASLSADESKASTLRERVNGLATALASIARDDSDARFRAGQAIENKVRSLPFVVESIAGRAMRVYDADLGFAAAYWSGEPCAAVRGVFNGKPYLAVGSNGVTLASLGVTGLTKSISPTFGIVE